MQRRCTLIACPACLPRSTRCWYDTSRVWPAEQSCRLHTLNILHPFFEISYLRIRNFLRPSSPTRSWAERYHSNNPVLNSSSSSVSAPATGSSLRCVHWSTRRERKAIRSRHHDCVPTQRVNIERITHVLSLRSAFNVRILHFPGGVYTSAGGVSVDCYVIYNTRCSWHTC